MDTGTIRATEDEALQFHSSGRPGKLSIAPTKPLTTQRDLSLAYSPGVAFPCLHIHRQPSAAFDYTSKVNFVAVISNGTAVLGLGDLGALAAKPVMEGKGALLSALPTSMRSISKSIPATSTRSSIACATCIRPLAASISKTSKRPSAL
jgi:malate dehydrogenase (oxaloacetate-decarboxylating)(NADP+)